MAKKQKQKKKTWQFFLSFSFVFFVLSEQIHYALNSLQKLSISIIKMIPNMQSFSSLVFIQIVFFIT